MIKGIHIAASSMLPYLKKQDVTANNLANINTPGFKKDGVFLKVLSETEKGSITGESDWEEPMVDEVYIDFAQGQLDFTGDDLNVAIEGDGFFVVSTPQGERYTRNGSFRLDSEGFLVMGKGYQVLTDGGPINITGNKVKIDEDGKVFVDGSQLGQFLVVDFAKPYQLVKAESGLFAPKSADISSQVADGYTIRQGFVERSNVGAIEEMIEMIGTLRDYESGQRSIRIQDESLEKLIDKLSK